MQPQHRCIHASVHSVAKLRQDLLKHQAQLEEANQELERLREVRVGDQDVFKKGCHGTKLCLFAGRTCVDCCRHKNGPQSKSVTCATKPWQRTRRSESLGCVRVGITPHRELHAQCGLLMCCAACVVLVCDPPPVFALQLEIGKDQIAKLTLLMSKQQRESQESFFSSAAGMLGWK